MKLCNLKKFFHKKSLFILVTSSSFSIGASQDSLSPKCESLNGVHIINQSDSVQTILYTPTWMSTRICTVKKPSQKMRNGIAPLHVRKNLSSKANSDFIELKLSPQEEVCCISASTTRVILPAKQDTLSAQRHQTIVVKDSGLN